MAGTLEWPRLPMQGFVAGRPATETDVAEENAVFVLKVDDKPVGRPLNIPVPQYALHVDTENGTETPVIIIQAETNGQIEVIGYLIIASQDFGVGLRSEFKFLGTRRPN